MKGETQARLQSIKGQSETLRDRVIRPLPRLRGKERELRRDTITVPKEAQRLLAHGGVEVVRPHQRFKGFGGPFLGRRAGARQHCPLADVTETGGEEGEDREGEAILTELWKRRWGS